MENHVPEKNTKYFVASVKRLNAIHGKVFSSIQIPLTEKAERKIKKSPIPIVIKLDNKKCNKLTTHLFIDKDLKHLFLIPSTITCNGKKEKTKGTIIFEKLNQGHIETTAALPCKKKTCNLKYNSSVFLIEE